MEQPNQRRLRSPKEKRERNLQRMQDLTPDEVAERAYQYAIFCLSRRERSSSEIREKVKAMGYTDEVVERTVQTLVERKFVDDARLTEMLARTLLRQTRGFRYVIQKLKTKGLSMTEEEFRRLTSENGEAPDLDRAIEWIVRRYPNYLTDLREKKKAMESLVRRGYSIDVAQDAVKFVPRENLASETEF